MRYIPVSTPAEYMYPYLRILNVQDILIKSCGEWVMLKVLYVLNHAGKGGTEKYVELLINKLNNRKIKAFFAYHEPGHLVEKLKAEGIETFQLKMRNPLDIKAAYDLAKLCRGLGIDIVHTNFLRENYIAVLSKMFFPRPGIVYTNHIILENNAVLKFMNRIITRFNSGVIAVCNPGKSTLISNGVNRKIIRVIHNGVDQEYWSREEKSTVREEFKIDEDTFVILCASRFAEYKGNRFLIDSIAEFRKIVDGKYVFLLANDGPMLEEVKLYAKALGLEKEVIFTGFRTDVKNLIGGCDLYVNPSEREALSFALVEVLASGIPIVSTDAGGTTDIINQDTNCGLLVKYGDAKGMAEKIYRLMKDKQLYNTLKNNALKTAAEKFSIDKMVMETYNLYKASCKSTQLKKDNFERRL